MNKLGDTKVCKKLTEMLESHNRKEVVLELIEEAKKHVNEIKDINFKSRNYFKDLLLGNLLDKMRRVLAGNDGDKMTVPIFWASMEVIEEYIKFKFDHDSVPIDEELMHPVQPLYIDEHGTLRFKRNPIVRDMLDLGKNDLNTLSMKNFSPEDWEQFIQLIGYSLSGFGDYDCATDRVYSKAKEEFDPDDVIDEHPNQPVIDGKYKPNKIVAFLYGANTGFVKVDSDKYSEKDRIQLYQLIGCSEDSEVFKIKEIVRESDG